MSEVTIKAVLFDFDDVICQTETFWLDSAAACLRGLGLQADMKKMSRMTGGTVHGKEKAMDEVFGDQEIYWQKKKEALHAPRPRFDFAKLQTPGIVETMRELKNRGLLICVASDSDSEKLEKGLNSCCSI